MGARGARRQKRTRNTNNSWACDWASKSSWAINSSALSDSFGIALRLCADGNTLAAGAYQEDSNAIGSGDDQTDDADVLQDCWNFAKNI